MTQVINMGWARCLPPVVCHIATLITVDVGIAACTVCVVVHVLDGSTALLGVAECAALGLIEISVAPRLGRSIHVSISAVIETDISVTACAVRVVDAGLSHNLENLLGVHFFLTVSAGSQS